MPTGPECTQVTKSVGLMNLITRYWPFQFWAQFCPLRTTILVLINPMLNKWSSGRGVRYRREWNREGKLNQRYVLDLVSALDTGTQFLLEHFKCHVECVWTVSMCLTCLPKGQKGSIYPLAPVPLVQGLVTWCGNPLTFPDWFPTGIPCYSVKVES